MFSSSGSTVTLAQLQRAFLHRTSTAIGAMFFVRAMQPHVPLGQASSLTQIMLPHVPLAYVRLVCFPILPMLDTGSAGRSDHPMLQRGEFVSHAAWAGRLLRNVCCRRGHRVGEPPRLNSAVTGVLM